jgi:hypothetical protein
MDKADKQFIKRLIRHIMISANKEPKPLWFTWELIENNGRFALGVSKLKGITN